MVLTNRCVVSWHYRDSRRRRDFECVRGTYVGNCVSRNWKFSTHKTRTLKGFQFLMCLAGVTIKQVVNIMAMTSIKIISFPVGMNWNIGMDVPRRPFVIIRIFSLIIGPHLNIIELSMQFYLKCSLTCYWLKCFYSFMRCESGICISRKILNMLDFLNNAHFITNC